MPVVHPPAAMPAQPSLRVPTRTATLCVRGLSYAYPGGQQALVGVDLEVRRGEKVALVGPNGAGKSTLILHLNGVLQGEGSVTVAGLPVEGRHLPTVRAKVGLVFQNPDDQLFSPTVFEDVAFGPLHMGASESDVRRRVTDALARVGMETYADRLSYRLSMGEKKRVAIATVLAMDPEILVLDEPTAGLDPRARGALIGLLADLPITMVVSTHDLAMVREILPRMVVMDAGRVCADGATDELLDDPAMLARHGLEA